MCNFQTPNGTTHKDNCKNLSFSYILLLQSCCHPGQISRPALQKGKFESKPRTGIKDEESQTEDTQMKKMIGNWRWAASKQVKKKVGINRRE